MTEINFRVPRPALEAFRFACMDDDRPNLSCIHFEVGDGSNKSKASRAAHAVAVDGHRLIHLEWVLDGDDKLDGIVEINAESVKDYLKAVGKPKRGQDPYVFHLKSKGDKYFLSVGNHLKSLPSFDVGPIENGLTFPRWRDVIPEKPTGTNEFSHKFNVDLSYVEELKKFMGACGCITKIVTIHYADKAGLGPVLFEPMDRGDNLLVHDAMKCEYIQMPIRA